MVPVTASVSTAFSHPLRRQGYWAVSGEHPCLSALRHKAENLLNYCEYKGYLTVPATCGVKSKAISVSSPAGIAKGSCVHKTEERIGFWLRLSISNSAVPVLLITTE